MLFVKFSNIIKEINLGSMRSRKLLRNLEKIFFYEDPDQIYSKIKESVYKQYWDRWPSQTIEIEYVLLFEHRNSFKQKLK